MNRSVQNNQDKKGFGFHQWCNFGSKHKGRSVYDIANAGDFEYLKFLQKANTQKKQNFFLTDDFLNHVNQAAQTRGTNSKWERVTCDPDDEGISKMYYVTTIGDRRIESTPIIYGTCRECKKSRNICLIKDSLCSVCYQNKKGSIPGAVQVKKTWQTW